MKFLPPVLTAFLALSLVACGSTPKKNDAAETPKTAVEGSNNADSQGANAGAGADGQKLNATSGATMMPSQTVLYFDYDSNQLRSEDSVIADAHAQYLRAYPSTRVRLEGHADERGSREYNLALGEQRAQSVRRHLTILGVSDTQVDTLSYGEESPFDPAHNEQSWAQNRRVEFIYLGGAK